MKLATSIVVVDTTIAILHGTCTFESCEIEGTAKILWNTEGKLE